MKKIIAALILIIFTLTVQPLYTGQVRKLNWEDLIPSELLSDDPLQGLTEEQRSAANWLIYMIENLPERNSESEEIYQMVDKAMLEVKEAGIDIKEIMEKRKLLESSMVNDLNGQEVSIPGYLLPLEMSGSKVIEFLLVPYVGACIHAPPPPPNQIVHVSVSAKKGFKHKGLFDPVMVTGMIQVKSLAKDLYLVDGSSNIDIGYMMQATQIKPYKK